MGLKGKSKGGFGKADAAMDYGAGDAAELAQAVKDLQRSDPGAKQAWSTYADRYGAGTKDPSKHDATFLQGFLSSYHSGQSVAPSGATTYNASGDVDLVAVVKLGQKSSASWKQMWLAYAQERGGGTLDPSKHDRTSLLAFLDYLATRAATGEAPAAQAMSGMVQTPAMKKRKVDGSAALGLGVMQTQLVNTIKGYCREGPDQKEQWTTYCDLHLGGTKDPSKSDPTQLQAFLDSVGVMVGSFGGPGGTPATVDPAKASAVDQVKAFQRMGHEQKTAWVQFCDTQPGMRKDPNAYDASVLIDFLSANGQVEA